MRHPLQSPAYRCPFLRTTLSYSIEFVCLMWGTPAAVNPAYPGALDRWHSAAAVPPSHDARYPRGPR